MIMKTFLLSLFFLIFTSFYSIAQCTLTTGSYTEADVEACLNACNCSTVLIDDGSTVTLSNDLDLSDMGYFNIYIVGPTGQLVFPDNGNNVRTLTISENSSITLEGPFDNPPLLVTGNSQNNPRVVVGDVEYYANCSGNRDCVQDIIDNGGVNPNLLPVSLMYFTGELIEDEVHLNWSTATETNNEKFIIQRRTLNSDWGIIGEVEGMGTTTIQQYYQYLDTPPSIGTYQYRILQVDEDGTSTAYHIIEIDYDNNISFSVFPNPTSNELYVEGFLNDPFYYTIYNLEGRVLQTGDTVNFIPVENLPSGVFILSVRHELRNVQFKFIKK